jgi:hypothetical protein
VATLKEYFNNDFTHVLNAGKPITLHFQNSPALEVHVRIHMDFNSNTKYVSCFLPSHTNPLAACVGVLNNLEQVLAITDGVEVHSGLPGEKTLFSGDLQFSGKIFFYSETQIPQAEFDNLCEQARNNGLALQYRGPDFAEKRSALEKPMAFISHDSRDKDEIARPIAIGLSKLMCPVWYDEYSLKVGDRLRESIEKGLKECKKCVLILSNNFLANQGWTKVEFNSIFTREIIETKDFVLPVWCGVRKEQIFEYCPSLVDKVGVNLGLGLEEVIRKLHRAII